MQWTIVLSVLLAAFMLQQVALPYFARSTSKLPIENTSNSGPLLCPTHHRAHYRSFPVYDQCIKKLSLTEGYNRTNPKCSSTITIYGEMHDYNQTFHDEQRNKANNGEIIFGTENLTFNTNQPSWLYFSVNGEDSVMIERLLLMRHNEMDVGDVIEMLAQNIPWRLSRAEQIWAKCQETLSKKNKAAFESLRNNYNEKKADHLREVGKKDLRALAGCMLEFYIQVSDIPEINKQDIACYMNNASYIKIFLQRYGREGIRQQDMAQNIKYAFDQEACPNNLNMVVIVGASHRGLVRRLRELGVNTNVKFEVITELHSNLTEYKEKTCRGE